MNNEKMTKPNLNNCDREPIHIPGGIQSHGFLIALDQSYAVQFCSNNISSFIDATAAALLGKKLPEIDIFGGEKGQQFNSMVAFFVNQDSGGQNCFPYTIGEQTFNVIVNQHGGNITLDFEPAGAGLAYDIQSLIGKSLSEILSDTNLGRLLNNAAGQIKKIIGYDRVMVYKFHEDGHGEVVAESKNEELESWVGLHYPASDIPKQARELYKINLVRLISDVYSSPSALVALPTDAPAVLDLTHSTLRAVSPIHIQYLKNMKVASSFSVSIMDHGKLWGLIACHNYTPRFINFRERESAKLVGQVLSSAISFREQEEDQQQAAEHRQAVEMITRHLLRNIAVEDALVNQQCSLKDVLHCTGAALYYENRLHCTGNVPDDAFIHKLIAWLGSKTYHDGYFMSQKLSEEFPLAQHYTLNSSGILACRLGKDLNEYMIWFRPELKSTVTWAGNPEKAKTIDEQGILHISPRTSFNAWSQQVEHTSLPWKKHELDAAISLRDEVNYAISRKATELRVINEKLRIAYSELDTFSYTISHDLKNPLATIRSYAQLIKRGTLDTQKTTMMAERIEKGTEKMQIMIDEVLAYSKAGQSRLEVKAINMQKLLEEIRQDLLISTNNPQLQIEINESPLIYGDEMMILQVFSNLIGNAVKYSRKSSPSIVSIAGKKDADETVYAISDNGIGIAEHEQQHIFELFARAKVSDEFEGTGVGLAIVKRIIEKHNGNIWLTSEPGKGSVFFVSFKRYEALHEAN